MDRNDMPQKAFASVKGENRLFQHHTEDVRDGNAQATVDLDRLDMCLAIAARMEDGDVKTKVLTHLVSHVQGIVGNRKAYAHIPEAINNGSAFPFFEVLRREQRLKHFQANLSTNQHMPPIFGPANASARFLYNMRTRELFYSIESFDLSTRETAAAIQLGDGKTLSTEAQKVLDLPVGRLKEGSVELSEEQEKLLIQGGLMVNIQTSEYPLGEIRGQIFPVDLSVSREGQPRSERPLTGNPTIDRQELPEEGDGAPTAPGVNAGEMASPTGSASQTKAPATTGDRQEELTPAADESAHPAAEPGKVESGQEDKSPKPLTDERPQTEPGDPEKGGGGSAGDTGEEFGQETKTPKADRDSSKVADSEPGSVEGGDHGDKKTKKKTADAQDKDDKVKSSDDAPSDEETFGTILANVSETTRVISDRFLRSSVKKEQKRLGKLGPSDLAAKVLSANAHLLDRSEVAALKNKPKLAKTDSNLTDPNNDVLKLELTLLDTPEKLKNFATSTAAQQENRKNTVLTASFIEIDGQVVKMDGDFVDPTIGPRAIDLLPDKVESAFSEDGKLLGMKARIVDRRKLSQTETIILIMEPDGVKKGEGPSFGLWMDIVRDEEDEVREVRMIDTFIPGVFLKDFGKFLQGLK